MASRGPFASYDRHCFLRGIGRRKTSIGVKGRRWFVWRPSRRDGCERRFLGVGACLSNEYVLFVRMSVRLRASPAVNAATGGPNELPRPDLGDRAGSPRRPRATPRSPGPTSRLALGLSARRQVSAIARFILAAVFIAAVVETIKLSSEKGNRMLTRYVSRLLLIVGMALAFVVCASPSNAQSDTLTASVAGTTWAAESRWRLL